eukprot:scaffold220667_cov18-Prasinocladus_malaysianus.AAC.1
MSQGERELKHHSDVNLSRKDNGTIIGTSCQCRTIGLMIRTSFLSQTLHTENASKALNEIKRSNAGWACIVNWPGGFGNEEVGLV